MDVRMHATHANGILHFFVQRLDRPRPPGQPGRRLVWSRHAAEPVSDPVCRLSASCRHALWSVGGHCATCARVRACMYSDNRPADSTMMAPGMQEAGPEPAERVAAGGVGGQQRVPVAHGAGCVLQPAGRRAAGLVRRAGRLLGPAAAAPGFQCLHRCTTRSCMGSLNCGVCSDIRSAAF